MNKTEMEKHPTRALAKFAVDLRFEDIPIDSRDHFKMQILDTLGSALYASKTPWGRIMADYVRDMDGRKESTVWGYGLKGTCVDAALANGTVSHGFELDDGFAVSLIHAGAVSVPAALAVAERRGGVDGKEFIAAVVAGYEVGDRVGRTMGWHHFKRGYHPAGTHGTWASAATTGKLLRLNEEQMVNAFGIAASQSAGLMAAQYGAMVKRMHAGRAAQSGLMAALLAQRGFTGIVNVLEVEFGGYATLSPVYEVNKATEALGEKLFSTESMCKPMYASCGSLHIEAARKLKNTYRIKPEDIEKIQLKMTENYYLHLGHPYEVGPCIWELNITAAQFNAAFGVAIELLGRKHLDQYTDEGVKDPAVLNLTRRTECTIDPLLGVDSHAYTVEIRMKDGQVHTATADSMALLTEKDVQNKFRELAVKALDKDTVEKILETVTHLEALKDVTRLADMLRPGT